MKKIRKILTPLMAANSTAIACFGLVGCNKMENLTQEVLDEFIGNTTKEIGGIVPVPRPGGYHEKNCLLSSKSN